MTIGLATKTAEYIPKQIASDELVNLEFELEVLLAARTMDVDQAEAIVRVEQGNAVDSLSSKEACRHAANSARQFSLSLQIT